MTTALQDTIDNLIKYILEYDSDTWISCAHEMTKEQAENIAANLIFELVTDDIDGIAIKDAYESFWR
jgi:hypothetical protein